MKKTLLFTLIGAFVLMGCTKQSSAPVQNTPESMAGEESLEAKTGTEEIPSPTAEAAMEETTASPTDTAMAKKAAKTFDVSGLNFSFDVKEIKVKQGDTVTINFKNTEGFHDWVVDEFSAKTKQIAAGQTDSVTFTADKKGTFEYYCSVGQHRKNGMVGKLIVE